MTLRNRRATATLATLGVAGLVTVSAAAWAGASPAGSSSASEPVSASSVASTTTASAAGSLHVTFSAKLDGSERSVTGSVTNTGDNSLDGFEVTIPWSSTIHDASAGVATVGPNLVVSSTSPVAKDGQVSFSFLTGALGVDAKSASCTATAPSAKAVACTVAVDEGASAVPSSSSPATSSTPASSPATSSEPAAEPTTAAAQEASQEATASSTPAAVDAQALAIPKGLTPTSVCTSCRTDALTSDTSFPVDVTDTITDFSSSDAYSTYSTYTYDPYTTYTDYTSYTSSSLARTGAGGTSMTIAVWGAVLLVAGGVLLFITRQRKRGSHQA